MNTTSNTSAVFTVESNAGAGEIASTPMPPKNVNKRPCTVLSPIEEPAVATNIDAIIESAIDRALPKSIESAIPKLIESMSKEVERMVKTAISSSMEALKEDIKKEIRASIKDDLDFSLQKANLHAKAEAEVLENYNRRDNVKILGLEEAVSANGQAMREDANQTLERVLKLTNHLELNTEASDISIAHRLPGNGRTARPVIVRYARRIARVNLLMNKKKLGSNEATKNIKVYEDLTRARMQFIRMMRSDPRINSVWTREGQILFQWANDTRVDRISNLHDGGLYLQYSLNDVMNCFEPHPRVFSNRNAENPS